MKKTKTPKYTGLAKLKPAFIIYKKEAHPNGPVTILYNPSEPFNMKAKMAFYKWLGHEVTPIK